MERVVLERLERMARNMPVEKLATHSIDSEQGVIYFAYGEDKTGKIHGIWGHREIGRTLEFKKGTSVSNVRRVLVNDAAGHIEQLIEKGLMSDAR
jgi:hypothetical protein